MTSLTWKDTYISGAEAIDAQHRKIFDMITSIHNELEDNNKKCAHFNGMLDQLELLCQLHFIDEEKFMEEINYPSTADHKHLHDLFLATIDRFKIGNKQCHAPNIINDFINIREDFISHMLNETMLLSNFIKDNKM